VANGHIIKCLIMGKMQQDMLDDNGNNLDAVILDIMHIPRLSRILFSITRFAKHGHFATIKQNYTTLYFSSKYAPVTLPAHDGGCGHSSNSSQVPWSRSHDHSSGSKQRMSIELLHRRLGHRKCQALLAASEHGV
jgi:hypothetical protein